jgi:hypothetical protein
MKPNKKNNSESKTKFRNGRLRFREVGTHQHHTYPLSAELAPNAQQKLGLGNLGRLAGTSERIAQGHASIDAFAFFFVSYSIISDL